MNPYVIHVLDWFGPLVASGMLVVIRRAGKIIRQLDGIAAKQEDQNTRLLIVEKRLGIQRKVG